MKGSAFIPLRDVIQRIADRLHVEPFALQWTDGPTLLWIYTQLGLHQNG